MGSPLVGDGSGGIPGVAGAGTSGSVGVLGASDTATAVVGISATGIGVAGQSGGIADGVSGRSAGFGVHGVSTASNGVRGESSASDHSAVSGSNSAGGDGVYGVSSGFGVHGSSSGNDGVHGHASASGYSGVAGVHSAGGHGVFGSSSGYAGYFDGALKVTGDATFDRDATFDKNVTVSGDLTAHDVRLSGQDCAEDFDLADSIGIEPGTVVVFSGEGSIRQSIQPYDKRVAGVVSGAGSYRPGVVLGRGRTLDGEASAGKAPVALIGRVYCKVDASLSSIAVGDMLTTSEKPGHAMKATDATRAFGAVIGKALAPVDAGLALIPILVTLQ